MRSPAGIRCRRGFLFAVSAYLQWPELIVFCVQFATEFTSAAAPRTVLQAAAVRAQLTKTTVTSFRTMIAPPFFMRNDHGRGYGCLSTP